MIAGTVYILCALTSLVCAVLLARGYGRARARLLLWCCCCFACLFVNNVMLFVDRVVYPDEQLFVLGMSLILVRTAVALIGVGLLVIGLIWDST